MEEERIEAMIDVRSDDELRRALSLIRAAHPYEKPAIHVLPMTEL